MADHRHEIAVPARLGAQNAEAVLVIVVGDPLDDAGQHFLGRSFRLRLHANSIIGLARVIPGLAIIRVLNRMNVLSCPSGLIIALQALVPFVPLLGLNRKCGDRAGLQPLK